MSTVTYNPDIQPHPDHHTGVSAGDLLPVEAEEEGFARVAKDVFAGSCGGIAQVLMGQPFDTTKVRMQSAPEGKYSGALDVIKQLIKNEGFAGFYKGTLTPLVGVGACVSIQFGVNEFMKRTFTAVNEKKHAEDPHILSSSQFYLSGAAAGVANSVLASPIEHIRIRLQTQTAETAKLYEGPLDAFRKIYSAAGIKGIFRGFTPCLVREAHGMGIYFMTFEALVKRDIKKNGLERKDIPGWRLCLYGAASGYSMWLSLYPVDVIKSKMQTDSIDPAKQAYKSSLDCAKQLYASAGIKGFFRGFLPTILRAAPANAITFYAFELTMRLIN